MKGIKQKDRLNEAVYILSRPWFLGLALGFLLIPTTRISSALGTGAEFLKIDTDAKAVSMGSAYTAMADGVEAMRYNPSGLAGMKQVELGFSHTSWLLDTQHDFIGVAMPAGKRSGMTIGLGLTRLSNGRIDSRNADRSVGNSHTAYDQAITASFAGQIKKTKVGIGAKYIESSLAGEKASAVAFDLGLMHGLGRLPLSVGLSVQNLGTPMKYISQKDPLPLTFAAGILVNVIPGFNMAMDVKRMVYDKRTDVSFGTEYSVLPMISLRTGYLMNNSRAGTGLNAINIGAGVNFWGTQFDYAVSPYGDLGNTQKITLKKKF